MSTVHEYGEHALLVEHDEPLRLWSALRGRDGVVDVVPAARTVLVTGPGARAALDIVLAEDLPPYSSPDALVEIPVGYDGVDLDAIDGLTADEVVALHTSVDYTVAFLGFAPGFPYLTGLPARLHTPRLATPRTSVPAGSVAIADEWCGIYPTSSPGGWRLLGRTDVTLFDPRRNHPTLLGPGTRVRFRAC